MTRVMEVPISTPFIKLDSLLKLANVVSSGGEAKLRIVDGQVCVNGQPCLERGKKIKKGDRVLLEDVELLVV